MTSDERDENREKKSPKWIELIGGFFTFQERALQLVDKTEGDFELSEGIRLVQTEEPSQARSIDEIQLSDDQETRESEVDSLLVDRIARFLGSHTMQFKVPKESIKDAQRSLEEGKSG